jgi:hypothetical protein
MRLTMLRIPLVIAIALASAPTHAALVTQVYRGTVLASSGAQGTAFHAGDRIAVTYVVDTTAADYQPDPLAGVFFGGLSSLQVVLPNVDVVTGAGTVQTFNDDPQPSDQVFFYSQVIAQADDVEGYAITKVEFDLIDWTAGMIANDAIPTSLLSAGQVGATLTTDLGRTYIQMTVDPSPLTVAELVVDGQTRLAALSASGLLRAGVAKALSSKLATLATAFAAGDVATACSTLADFRAQVSGMQRAGQISAAVATELLALAQVLREAAGGC